MAAQQALAFAASLPYSVKLLGGAAAIALVLGLAFGMHAGVDVLLLLLGGALPLLSHSWPMFSRGNPRWYAYWLCVASLSVLESVGVIDWRNSLLFAAVKLLLPAALFRFGPGLSSTSKANGSTRVMPDSATGFFGYYCNELDRVEKYIASGADLDAEVIANGSGIVWDDSQWKPPLHWAARLQSRSCAEALLAAGADPFHRDRKFGLTALEVARAEDAPPDFLLIYVNAMRRVSKATSMDDAQFKRVQTAIAQSDS